MQPPELIWSGPDAITNADVAIFTASHTDVVTFECILDDSVLNQCGASFQVESLSEGTHVMRVRARDEARNWSDYTEIEWVVDLRRQFYP